MNKVSPNKVTTGPRKEKTVRLQEKGGLKNFLYAESTDPVQGLVLDVILP